MPTYEGLLLRGLPNRDEVETEYKAGRPIQWGAFVSTTTSILAAKEFCDKEAGVIVRISAGYGKKLGAISFFVDEEEVLLSPNAKFVVSAEVYQEAGWWFLDLVQQRGDWFVF
mmetsp:Transcript_112023/g.198465  ORF Transcript_112023/g.198465 Transcript_112023/m.198465 type:complete len:113 (+) Transcript_112023:206-544(+)